VFSAFANLRRAAGELCLRAKFPSLKSVADRRIRSGFSPAAASTPASLMKRFDRAGTPIDPPELGRQITGSCFQSLRAAKRRSDSVGCFADPVIGRRLAPNRCHIYVRGYRNQRRMCLLLRAAAISESCALRWAQGNRDEENSCCRTDRRIIYFGRSKSSRSCWRCCLGRGVGGGRPGTCGRGGGCVHWIYSRAFDRAFLGTWAVRIAISGATYSTIKPRNPSAWNPRGWSSRASGRQDKFAASCQIFRDASREESRAACSGI
jgi:hypothetical protein